MLGRNATIRGPRHFLRSESGAAVSPAVRVVADADAELFGQPDPHRKSARVYSDTHQSQRRLRVLDAPLLQRLRREALDGGEGCGGRARRIGLVGAEQLGARVLVGATRRTHVVRLGRDAATVLGRPVTPLSTATWGAARATRARASVRASERPRLPWTVADVPVRVVDVATVDDRQLSVCDVGDTLRDLRSCAGDGP